MSDILKKHNEKLEFIKKQINELEKSFLLQNGNENDIIKHLLILKKEKQQLTNNINYLNNLYNKRFINNFIEEDF